MDNQRTGEWKFYKTRTFFRIFFSSGWLSQNTQNLVKDWIEKMLKLQNEIFSEQFKIYFNCFTVRLIQFFHQMLQILYRMLYFHFRLRVHSLWPHMYFLLIWVFKKPLCLWFDGSRTQSESEFKSAIWKPSWWRIRHKHSLNFGDFFSFSFWNVEPCIYAWNETKTTKNEKCISSDRIIKNWISESN